MFLTFHWPKAKITAYLNSGLNSIIAKYHDLLCLADQYYYLTQPSAPANNTCHLTNHDICSTSSNIVKINIFVILDFCHIQQPIN